MLIWLRMKHALFPFLVLLGCALQFSCSQNQQQPHQETDSRTAAEKVPPPLYLGTVHQVFPDDKFVLVRMIGPRPAEGTVLITHPEDGSTARVGNLIISSAQHARSSIIAADIRAGVVMKGDRVFQYRNIATAPIQEEEAPEPEPEAFTLSGDQIDLGYVPPEVRARREKLAKLREQQSPRPVGTVEPIAQEKGPAPSFMPDGEDESPAPAPDFDVPQGLPRLDDVPDTISGWDAM